MKKITEDCGGAQESPKRGFCNIRIFPSTIQWKRPKGGDCYLLRGHKELEGYFRFIQFYFPKSIFLAITMGSGSTFIICVSILAIKDKYLLI